MKKLLRRFLYPKKFERRLYQTLQKYIDIKNFYSLVDKSPYKKILIMDSLAFNFSMRQRPQQLADEFTKYFDMVYYKTGNNGEFEQYSDKMYLCPQIGIKKFKNKQVYYYIDSINEKRDYKYLYKIKKYADKFIYDYIDEITPHIAPLKISLGNFKRLGKINPDVISATSKKLYKDIETRFGNKNLVLSSNGVKIEDFANRIPAEPPNDLKDIVSQGKPIVGYYGMLAKWVDFNLLNKLSEAYPEYNFVYLGRDVGYEAKKLVLRDNVYFLGRKAYEDLPKYTYYFNCCMIPFKHGKIAKATSPVKLFEYMAQKKPVVCTRDLVECSGYDGVLMSDNDEEFIKNIKTAINSSNDENIKEKLYKYAEENTWAQKAKIIMEKLDNDI